MLSQDVEMLNYSHTISNTYAEAGREIAVPAAKPYIWSNLLSNMRFLLVTILAVLGVFYALNAYLVQQSYEMQRLRSDIIALEKSNEVMRLEVAKLESPLRIQHIAETRLGMHVPKHAIYGSHDTAVDVKQIHD